MSKLCERPGCSEPGAAEYGMVPEDLLFWISALNGTVRDDQNVLCLRHADALTVPRGWTLDDRREEFPRLFRPRTVERPERAAAPRRRRPPGSSPDVEQLVIDGTGEIERPVVAPEAADPASDDDVSDIVASDQNSTTTTLDDPAAPWQPEFDHDSDLDGLLEVTSPLLARAFRGTDRRRD